MSKVPTPGVHTIRELVDYLGIPIESTAKILFYWAVHRDGRQELLAPIVLGHRELNEAKLMEMVGAEQVAMAPAEDVARLTGAPLGSAGPVGLKGARIILDQEVAASRNVIYGANEDGYHIANVNCPRDFDPDAVADLRLVGEGDRCPRCSAGLKTAKGFEVAQVSRVPAERSEALGYVYSDDKGKKHVMFGGSYRIGISRVVAAIVEQHFDENGIIWPLAVAPYQCMVVCVNSRDAGQARLAAQIYDSLGGQGIEAMLDDRDERAGVKFKDADLLGFPFRINVGKKASEGTVELVERGSKQVREFPWTEAVSLVAQEVTACSCAGSRISGRCL